MDRIFAEAAKSRRQDGDGSSHSQARSQGSTTTATTVADGAKLPPGMVIGPDGKPCRSCNSFAAMTAARKQLKTGDSNSTTSKSSSPSRSSPSSSSSSSAYTSTSAALSSSLSTANTNTTDTSDLPTLPANCPPDVERLGNHTWTLLHSMAATYPERAPSSHQADMRGFLNLFSKLYPCWSCASDFRDYMGKTANEPRLEGRESFGRWLCDAHNDVNRKLGKPEFDCSKWRERWVDGWKDGSCDP